MPTIPISYNPSNIRRTTKWYQFVGDAGLEMVLSLEAGEAVRLSLPPHLLDSAKFQWWKTLSDLGCFPLFSIKMVKFPVSSSHLLISRNISYESFQSTNPNQPTSQPTNTNTNQPTNLPQPSPPAFPPSGIPNHVISISSISHALEHFLVEKHLSLEEAKQAIFSNDPRVSAIQMEEAICAIPLTILKGLDETGHFKEKELVFFEPDEPSQVVVERPIEEILLEQEIERKRAELEPTSPTTKGKRTKP